MSDERPFTPAAGIVVLERSPRLSPAIRRRIVGRRASVCDVRTVPDLVAWLESRPGSGVLMAVVDFATAPGGILLALSEWRDRCPLCRWGVLLDESTRHAEWSLREAGAARVDFAPCGIEELATFCEACLPPREAAEHWLVLDLLSRHWR